MSLIDNASKIAATSLYPTDMIVDVLTGSFLTDTSPNVLDSFGFAVYKEHSISHSFTRPVFTKLKWSLDGLNWVDGGLGQLRSDPLIYCQSLSTSSEVKIYTTLLSGTVYYEIICFWIPDYDATNPSVEPFYDPTKPIMFDSQLNYQKLYLPEDSEHLTFSSTSSRQVIEHNLGYRPNTWVYFESNPGEVWPAMYGGTDNVWLHKYSTQGELGFDVYSDRVVFDWSAGVSFSGSARAWYRIYLDA